MQNTDLDPFKDNPLRPSLADASEKSLQETFSKQINLAPASRSKEDLQQESKQSRGSSVLKALGLSDAADLLPIGITREASTAVAFISNDAPPGEPGLDDEEDSVIPPPMPLEAKKPPKIGDRFDFKGEKLKFVGDASDYALLHEPGRHSNYAVRANPVTDADLDAKFQELNLVIEGKPATRYIQKGNPAAGVFQLIDIANNKTMYRDHAFEVVAKTDLAQAPRSDKSSERDSKNVDRPPDADRDRSAKMSNGRPAEERTVRVDGKDVKIRTPENHFDAGMRREVEIDGKTIKLERRSFPRVGQPWYFSEEEKLEIDMSAQQVKLHITGVNAPDVARLQAVLLPALEELRQKGDVYAYKTFDPNFMDGAWQDHPDRFGKGPGPKGQYSKAFTIFADPEKAQEIAKELDKILKEKGLALDGFTGDTVGEKSRLKGESRRVSLDRDMWRLTCDVRGLEGALLDEQVAKKLHEKYKSAGVDNDGRLTNEALTAAEKDAGILPGQLTYDREGRLMFLDGGRHSEKKDGGRVYLDESHASRSPGEKTGRPAIYALYEQAGVEPAQAYLEQVKALKEVAKVGQVRPARVPPTVDRLQGTETRTAGDGTYTSENVRPGEVLAREQLERRDRVDPKEIEALRKYADELAKSEKETERDQAKVMKRALEALDGVHGPATQAAAHRIMLEESRRALSHGEGGGYGRAITGGLIGVGVLASAALGYYIRGLVQQQEKSLERAKIK